MFETPRSTRIVRRLFGLPGEAPQLTPCRTEKIEDGPYAGNFRVVFKEGAEKQAEQDAWYAEGARGEWADRIGDWINPRIRRRQVSEVWASLRDRLRSPGFGFQPRFVDAQQLTFKSPYLIGPEDHAIEGWLVAEKGEKMTMTVVSAAKTAEHLHRLQTQSGWFEQGISSNTTTDLYGNWIMVADDLDDATLIQAIQNWYRDEFALTRYNRDRTPEILIAVERSESNCGL